MSEDDVYSYEPKRGHGLRHDPFNAIIAPRPIGWIASRAADGTLNLAPYSFFNAFNYVPPIVGFSSVGWKDTVRNVAQTKAFVWNVATRALAEAMNATSASLPPEADEFAHAGLTPVASRIVDVPRVAQSPVAFECVLTQQVRLATKEGADVAAWLTLGEVVAVHIRRDLIVDGAYDLASSGTILRAGRGGDYVEIRPDAFFEMPRPG